MVKSLAKVLGTAAAIGATLTLASPATAGIWVGYGYRPAPPPPVYYYAPPPRYLPPPPPLRYLPARPIAYGYGYRPRCHSWWHWDGYAGAYVRVHGCN